MYYKTIIFLILITTNVYAADIENNYLQPDISIFSGFRIVTDYYSKVVELFSKAYGPSIKIRTVVLPSFESEYVIGIREKENKYYVFKLSAKSSIWGEYQKTRDKKILDKSPQNEIEVQEAEAEISQQVYKILDECWHKMLQQIKYKRLDGLDGTTYHFSTSDLLAGYAWSPNPNSQTGHLVKLTELLGQLAESKDQKAIEKQLMSAATTLIKTLK